MRLGASALKRVPSDPSVPYRCEARAKASEVIFAEGPVKRAAGLRPVSLPVRPGPARVGFWAAARDGKKVFGCPDPGRWHGPGSFCRGTWQSFEDARFVGWDGVDGEHIDHSTKSAPAGCRERVWPAGQDRAGTATAKAAGM